MTMGGQKARQAFLAKVDIDDFNTKKQPSNNFSSNGKDDPYQKNNSNLGQSAAPALERLYKQLLENQQTIEKLCGVSNGQINGQGDYKGYY